MTVVSLKACLCQTVTGDPGSSQGAVSQPYHTQDHPQDQVVCGPVIAIPLMDNIYCTVQCTLHFTVYTVLYTAHCTALHSAIVHCTEHFSADCSRITLHHLHCIVQYFTICTKLNYNALHCTALHCTTLTFIALASSLPSTLSVQASTSSRVFLQLQLVIPDISCQPQPRPLSYLGRKEERCKN